MADKLVNKEFLEMTDKKAYGGKRMIEMIRNILGISKINIYRGECSF